MASIDVAAQLSCSARAQAASSRTRSARTVGSRQLAPCAAKSRFVCHAAFDDAAVPRSGSLAAKRRPRSVILSASAEPSAEVAVAPRDDDVLPDSLYDAVIQAGKATASAINSGTQGALVEILVPELWDQTSGNIMREEGDQQRMWELTRFFVENLIETLGFDEEEAKGVRAIYPDAGVAALLTARWQGAPFTIASLNDRTFAREGDRVCIVCAPDPQGVEEAEKVANKAAEVGAAVVLINPRLASGDAGIGLNVRRMRDRFLSRLTVTYSLRPMGTGTVFRSYPGPYQVFVEDSSQPGRYRLIQETIARPGGEELMELMDSAMAAGARGGAGAGAEGGAPPQEGVVENLTKTVKSMMRFMNSLK